MTYKGLGRPRRCVSGRQLTFKTKEFLLGIKGSLKGKKRTFNTTVLSCGRTFIEYGLPHELHVWIAPVLVKVDVATSPCQERAMFLKFFLQSYRKQKFCSWVMKLEDLRSLPTKSIDNFKQVCYFTRSHELIRRIRRSKPRI